MIAVCLVALVLVVTVVAARSDWKSNRWTVVCCGGATSPTRNRISCWKTRTLVEVTSTTTVTRCVTTRC
uniref:Putative secreted peptide n=1 Tax=Anopheles braziliensis TaxID=58242 RepID=A0A2M3ZWW5_9DIPT